MWIQNTNEATRRLYVPWMDDEVESVIDDLPGDDPGIVFDGPVQVVVSVGERLIDEYDSIEEYETDSGDTTIDEPTE